MILCFPWIKTGNETGITSDVLGAYLAICTAIVSSLNYYTRSLLNNSLFLVIIETLIVCRDGHEYMVLHATPSARVRETVTGFMFTTKEFF